MIRIFRFSAVCIGLMLSFTFSVQAQTGDADAGKQKSATCAACHGPDGNSPLDQFPKIAGQVPGHIAKQLADFKTGVRVNPVMAGMSAGLSDQDMADLDAFYASQEMSAGSITEEQHADALLGQTIYKTGIAEFNVPACMSCHGPSGSGILPNFPKLSGQYANYLEAQLLAFKSGDRSNPIMNPIAFPLSADQIKQLSLYISALQ